MIVENLIWRTFGRSLSIQLLDLVFRRVLSEMKQSGSLAEGQELPLRKWHDNVLLRNTLILHAL